MRQTMDSINQTGFGVLFSVESSLDIQWICVNFICLSVKIHQLYTIMFMQMAIVWTC